MPISSRPQLREELEIIKGLDDIPLVYDPVSGSYHRISEAGETILTWLDGARTREELAALMAGGRTQDAPLAREKLDRFLGSLHDVGLLKGSDPAPGLSRRGRFQTSMLMPRFVISRSLPTLLEPLARGLRKRNTRLLFGSAGLVSLVGFALGIYALISSVPPILEMLGPAFIIAACLQIMVMFVHETAHTLVAQVLRVPVRGLGVALLFYFMPLAYVDRTDAYRVRGRQGRIALALAGIVSDGWFTGLAGIVALTTTGPVQHVAAFFLFLQVCGLVVNTNPLLPSDGYAAIEAGTGALHMRGRAFSLLVKSLLRQPLPVHLARLSAGVKAAHVAYAIASIIYVCFLALGMFMAMSWMTQLIGVMTAR